jgi:uncharacterized protein YaiI (UPF0178 family)
MRNLMDQLRSSGTISGGPSAISNSDRMAFANQLDRLLARLTAAAKTESVPTGRPPD